MSQLTLIEIILTNLYNLVLINYLIMIFEIDDNIPFCNRNEHKQHTIRQIIRYDSGYLKDLFTKDKRLVFSLECYKNLMRLTKGHRDNWEKPINKPNSIFNELKTYKTPYLFDFNDSIIESENTKRLNNEYKK